MCINRNAELLPYYEKAKELLDYNPITGFFVWKVKRRGKAIKGSIAGTKATHNGINIRVDGKNILGHRLAWFIYYGEMPSIIDHIDNDRTNNKIKNLRQCSQSENQMNRSKQKNNSSGFKGVSWGKKENKWKAQIGHKGKKYYLGSFDCPKEASKAYEEKAKELHGEFYYE